MPFTRLVGGVQRKEPVFCMLAVWSLAFLLLFLVFVDRLDWIGLDWIGLWERKWEGVEEGRTSDGCDGRQGRWVTLS